MQPAKARLKQTKVEEGRVIYKQYKKRNSRNYFSNLSCFSSSCLLTNTLGFTELSAMTQENSFSSNKNGGDTADK